MSSGTFYLKTDRTDPGGVIYTSGDATIVPPNKPAVITPHFYGGIYGSLVGGGETPEITVNRYVQVIEESGVTTLVLKLDSLGGTGPDQYVLQNNIDAFTAAYLTPLKITRVAAATLPSATIVDTLYITWEYRNNSYTPTDEADTFLVKIKNINTPNRVMNVARIMRAVLNGKRDNSFVAAMIMLANLRDDQPHKFSGTSYPLAATATGPATSPLNGLLGPVVPFSSTDRNPHVGFAWPVDIIDPTSPSALSDGETWFRNTVRDRVLSSTGIDVLTLTWITFSAYPAALNPYLGMTFKIDDDPTKAFIAIGIVDFLKSGIYSYIEFLRGVWKSNNFDAVDPDPNIQRGVFAHLDDTDQARDDDFADVAQNISRIESTKTNIIHFLYESG